jgi:hypothetical protein
MQQAGVEMQHNRMRNPPSVESQGSVGWLGEAAYIRGLPSDTRIQLLRKITFATPAGLTLSSADAGGNT